MSYRTPANSHRIRLQTSCVQAVRALTSGSGKLLLLIMSLLPMTAVTPLYAVTDKEEEWQRIEDYFDGLRSRGLYSLAQTVCHRKLNDDRLDLLTRTRYAVELSRTLTGQSRTAATVSEQTELLKQARDAVQQILDKHRNHPQRILLESQLTFVAAGELESLRFRVALSPFDDSLTDRAVVLAESLIPALQQLDEQAGREARTRRTPSLGDQLQPHQLRELRRLIQMKLGTVLLDKARLFSKSTPDRADALTQAAEVLRQVAAVSVDDQTMWQSQLNYVTTLRLLGRPAQAWDMINAMRSDDPPLTVLDDLAVEHVELLIDEGRLADAADYLRTHQKQRRGLTGPLSYLTARVYLRLSQIAEEKERPELAAELLQEVHRAVRNAADTGNSYWATRAQNLLAEEKSRSTYGAEIGALVQAGQSLYAAGDEAGATRQYAQAFETAQARSDRQVAAEIGYTYGSILLKQKKYSDASAVFRRVTTLAPSGSRAADADLLHAWCLGLEYREHPDREHREAYMAALDSHRATWPESATAAEATWMLAQLQEQLLQTTKALSLYATIPDEHPRYAESAVGIARCSETILNRLRRMNRDRSEWEPAITTLLAPYIEKATRSEVIVTGSQADFLVRVARIQIMLDRPDFATADRLLAHVLNSRSTPSQADVDRVPQHIMETAVGLRIVSLTGLQQSEQAMELLRSTVILDRQRLSSTLKGLSSAAEYLEINQRRQVARLQLAAVAQAGLDPGKLSAEELGQFGSVIATAFEQTAQTDRAVEILRQLLARNPRDTKLRRRVAEILSRNEDAASLTAAQQELRRLEEHFEPGSTEWMNARLSVIEIAIRLKNTDEARKLLKVTQLLYPSPDSDELKRRLKEVSEALASGK